MVSYTSLTMKRRGWSSSQLQYLQENYHNMSADELSIELGKTKRAIYTTAHSLKLGKRKKTTPIKTMLHTEAAYMAGVFDGDGHVGIYRDRRGHYGIRLTIGTIYLPYAETIVDMTGLSGPYSSSSFHVSKHSQREAKVFLTQILPYLRLKKAEVETVIKFINREIPGDCAIEQIKKDRLCRGI